MSESSDRDDRGRFKPGNALGFSSNPDRINRKGRPPRPSITAALHRRLEEVEREDGEATGKQIVDALVKTAIREALRGSFAHLKEVWNRVDGKDNPGVELVEGEEPVSVEDHRTAAIHLYRSIIIDPSSAPKDRLTAQESLNRLLGLVDDNAGNTAEETAARIRDFLSDTEVVNEDVEDTQTPPAPE